MQLDENGGPLTVKRRNLRESDRDVTPYRILRQWRRRGRRAYATRRYLAPTHP
jgi:hypothetical protein